MIYDRLHTREIDRYGGLAINMPRYAVLFMLFTMASVGLPGTSNFVGEFLSLAGTYRCRPRSLCCARPGIILGAAYMLYLYRRVVFGELTKDDVKRDARSVACANWPCSRRSPPWCCGWASIPRASSRRCAGDVGERWSSGSNARGRPRGIRCRRLATATVAIGPAGMRRRY